jgi:hypothetical protein
MLWCFPSAFLQSLSTNREEAIIRLKKRSVSVVICSRITDMNMIHNLLYIIAEDIQLYPPLQCQLRNIIGHPTSNIMSELNVVSRMSYVGRVRCVMFWSRMKALDLFYQVHEKGDGGKQVTYAGTDHLLRDAEYLKRMIKDFDNPELKCDIRPRADSGAESSLVVKFTFGTTSPNMPACFSEGNKHKGSWVLESILAWPSFEFDVPLQSNILEGDSFYLMTEHLGYAVFGFLNYHGLGRSPI